MDLVLHRVCEVSAQVSVNPLHSVCGTLTLLELDELFVKWEALDPQDSKYSFQIALTDVILLKRQFFILGSGWVVFVTRGGVGLPPLQFAKGALSPFLVAVAKHCVLLPSDSDSRLFDVLPIAFPLPLILPQPRQNQNKPKQTDCSPPKPHRTQTPTPEAEQSFIKRNLATKWDLVKNQTATGISIISSFGFNYQQPPQQQPQHHNTTEHDDFTHITTTSTTSSTSPTSSTSSTSSSTPTTPTSQNWNVFPNPYDAATSVGSFELIPTAVNLNKQDRESSRVGMCKQRWEQLIDRSGKVKHPAAVCALVFRVGVAQEMREVVWKFLVGYYPWTSTLAERCEIDERKKKEYEVYKQQWVSVTEMQQQRFEMFRDRKNRIEKDVLRTDRHEKMFSDVNGSGITVLRNVLMSYSLFNFDLGYCQGMSDVVSVLMRVMQRESDVFWAFVCLMDNRMGKNFDQDQLHIQQLLEETQTVLQIVEPKLYAFLEAQGCESMVFVFRWLLIHFKREMQSIDHVLQLWEAMWTNHLTPRMEVLCVVGVLCAHAQTITENNMQSDDLVVFVNKLSATLDAATVLSGAERTFCTLKTALSNTTAN